MNRMIYAVSLVACTLAGLGGSWASDPDYSAWPPLVNPFESTSGGGVMIDDYRPIIVGNTCTTDFTVRLPDGARLLNEIVFEAKSVQGGILCTNGKWRSKDGSSSGTTPFEMFLKDGRVKRSP